MSEEIQVFLTVIDYASKIIADASCKHFFFTQDVVVTSQKIQV